MNTTLITTIIIAIITLLGYGASFLVPIPDSWDSSSMSFHTTLANSVLYTLLHTGAAILFVLGVSAYKLSLRKAYIKIAIGVALVGGGLAHVVLLNIFGLIQTPWVQYGGVMLPFIIAGVAIYSGVRSMAALIGVRSRLQNIWLILSAIILTIAIVSLLPHRPLTVPESFFDIANAISLIDVVLYTAALGLVFQINSRSGAHYAKAIRWLAIGLVGSVGITSYVLIRSFTLGQEPSDYILDTIVIFGGLLYVKAGYSFAKTKEL